MSNFTTVAEAMARKINFEEECKNGIGRLTITGLSFPENKTFYPLDKIWSSIRKRNAEAYGVYTTAVFSSPSAGVIHGEFYPNHANIDEDAAEQYTKRFEDTFSLQILLFADAIISFLMDYELGYTAYCKYLEKAAGNPSPEECGSIIDAFLRRYRFKTDEDDAEKRRREERSRMIMNAKLMEFASLIGF